MSKEWKIWSYIVGAATTLMIVGWVLYNTPHEWILIVSFVLLFSIAAGVPTYAIIAIKHHHHRVTEHPISQYGTVLSQHGELHKFDPVHPSIGGMNVYHHQASLVPQQKELPDPDPDDTIPPDVKVTEEFSPQRLLISMTAQQQTDLIDHLANTGILSRVKDQVDQSSIQDDTTPDNVTAIDPLRQRARELYNSGVTNRNAMALELKTSENRARGYIEQFKYEDRKNASK